MSDQLGAQPGKRGGLQTSDSASPETTALDATDIRLSESLNHGTAHVIPPGTVSQFV